MTCRHCSPLAWGSERGGAPRTAGEALSAWQAGPVENGPSTSYAQLGRSRLPGEQRAQSPPGLYFYCCLQKKPLSSCWSSAPAGPVCGRGTRGGGAAETGHSQHANTNHFFVKSFPNGERRHLSHGPPPGVAPLPHSHLNRRTNSPTQMENRTTRERSILRNTWKLLTASVKYMKFW